MQHRPACNISANAAVFPDELCTLGLANYSEISIHSSSASVEPTEET
jgi:hypothetical protein